MGILSRLSVAEVVDRYSGYLSGEAGAFTVHACAAPEQGAIGADFYRQQNEDARTFDQPITRLSDAYANPTTAVMANAAAMTMASGTTTVRTQSHGSRPGGIPQS